MEKKRIRGEERGVSGRCCSSVETVVCHGLTWLLLLVTAASSSERGKSKTRRRRGEKEGVQAGRDRGGGATAMEKGGSPARVGREREVAGEREGRKRE